MPEDPQHGGRRPERAANGLRGRRVMPDGWPELFYRELVERVPAVLYVDASDETSSALYMSARGETLLGYSREEWLGVPGLWVEILHPEDRERVLAEHDRARQTGSPFEAEYRLIARDGSVVWVRDEAAPVGDDEPARRVGALLDVTERKRYEEELRRSEERFRLVAGVTGKAIWDNDLLTGVQEWDGATEALFGYPPHRARTGRWWEERVHPEDRERVLAGLSVLFDRGGETWEDEYRFRRADGSYARVADRGHVARDEATGEPVRMVGAMMDITERRRWEEKLRENEECFRTTFEAAPVGMAHLSPDGRWLRINDRLCEISGCSREELLSLTFLDLTLPQEREASLARMRGALEGRVESYSLERSFARKDGSRAWVDLSVALVRSSSGEPRFFVCIAEDVRARKIRELIPNPLTPIEMEVLTLVSEGKTNLEIAGGLRYSVGTIKRHVQGIIAKLGVATRTEAAARAVEIGLVPPLPY